MPNEQQEFIDKYVNKPFKINNVIPKMNKGHDDIIQNPDVENIFKQTEVRQKRPHKKILTPEQNEYNKSNKLNKCNNLEKRDYLDYKKNNQYLEKDIVSDDVKRKKNHYDEKEVKKFLYTLRSHKTPNDLPYEACSTGLIDNINSINNCNSCFVNISGLEYRSGGPMGCGPL